MNHLLITKNLQREQVLFLAEQGVDYKVVPALTSNFTYNLNQISEILDQNSIWIFTSSKAVFSIASQLAICKNKAEQRIATVGENSKTELKKLGFEKILSFPTSNELTKTFDSHPEDKFVFFCGNNSRREIPEYAKLKGFNFQQVQVYETQKAEPVIETNGFGAAFYFSPLGVESTLANNPQLKELKAYAIGETTAQALKKNGIEGVVVPKSSNVNEMIQQFLQDKEV